MSEKIHGVGRIRSVAAGIMSPRAGYLFTEGRTASGLAVTDNIHYWRSAIVVAIVRVVKRLGEWQKPLDYGHKKSLLPESNWRPSHYE